MRWPPALARPDPWIPVVVFALTAAVSLVLLARYGVPEPRVHDEHSYLLGADTFLEGRLTNPTPPHPSHFETFHVLLEPTYQSKYPPGQALTLALGTWAFGAPIYGVLLFFALGAATTSWAASAVLRPPWALLPGLLVGTNPSLVSQWAFSYWGSGVALLGAGLFFGGLLRNAYGELRLRHTIPMLVGLFVLSITRPLEGLLTAALPLAVLVGFGLRKGTTGRARSRWWRRFGIPLCAAGVATLAAHTYYHWRVTGDPLLPPHAAWKEALDTMASPLVRSYGGSPPLDTAAKLERLASVFVAPLLWVSAFGLIRARKDWKWLLGLLVLSGVLAVVTLTSRAWAHYYAPVVPLYYVLVVAGFRELAGRMWRGIAAGAYVAALALGGQGVAHAYTMAAPDREDAFYRRMNAAELHAEAGWLSRSQLEELLDQHASARQHLVFVRYLPGHSLHHEWVYNRARIETAKVIYARLLSDVDNRELAEDLDPDHVWLLEVRNRPLRLCHYEGLDEGQCHSPAELQESTGP